MDCRTPTGIEFRFKLGFNQHDIIMTKEQTVLTGIMKIFASEKILLQHYKIDLYFPEHKLAIEVDEKGHKDISIDHEIKLKKQKAIKKELDCEFNRINPDEKDFDMDIYINKTQNHITESSKISLTDKILNTLLQFEFKTNHSIKSRGLNYALKEIFPSL